MHISLKFFFACFLLLLISLTFQKLYADRMVESQKLVKSLYSDLVSISMKELTIDQQKNELNNLFQKYVDIPIIARAVLGKSWRGADSDQRKRFIHAFKIYCMRIKMFVHVNSCTHIIYIYCMRIQDGCMHISTVFM